MPICWSEGGRPVAATERRTKPTDPANTDSPRDVVKTGSTCVGSRKPSKDSQRPFRKCNSNGTQPIMIHRVAATSRTLRGISIPLGKLSLNSGMHLPLIGERSQYSSCSPCESASPHQGRTSPTCAVRSRSASGRHATSWGPARTALSQSVQQPAEFGCRRTSRRPGAIGRTLNQKAAQRVYSL